MFCLAGKGSAKAARMPRLRLTRRGKRARGQRAAEILTASRFTGRSIASVVSGIFWPPSSRTLVVSHPLNEAQKQLCHRVALMSSECERREARSIAGEAIDLELIRAANRQDRAGVPATRLGARAERNHARFAEVHRGQAMNILVGAPDQRCFQDGLWNISRSTADPNASSWSPTTGREPQPRGLISRTARPSIPV